MVNFSHKTAQSYYDDGKEDLLWDWVNNTGDGIMGVSFGDLPDDCFSFCMSQYQRFNIPVGEGLLEAVRVGASASLYYADIVNPYAMFSGVSDIDMSMDWATTTYRIFDCAAPDKRSYEPDPASVESFILVPGQSERCYNEFLSKPGLLALPHGHEIDEILSGDYYSASPFESLTSKGVAALSELCNADHAKMRSFLELGAWAAYVWLMGPPSLGFRIYAHEIVNMGVNEGECIIVDGQMISPKFYNKIDRPPQSCYHCGAQTWCVEHSLTGTHLGFICEACLNYDLPKNRFSNCGSKFCSLSLCPNHPYHHMGQQGAFRSRRESGYLLDIARSKSIPQIMGGPTQRLLQ